MDREALRSVEGNAGIPDYLRECWAVRYTALLIDLEAESQEALDAMIDRTREGAFRL